MASPEALLLRHRMYTTNICKKVIRSPLCRLFKIGHLCVYFLSIFNTPLRRLARLSPREPASSKMGFSVRNMPLPATTWQLP